MFNVSMKTMLEAGVHFGHQTYKWNPKMARFIFGERNGIHILDLQKTLKELKKAYAFVSLAAKEGKHFIFVGTKKQAKDILREEALRANVPCVYEKWLGGTLTNFETIRKSIKRLEELEDMETKGYFRVMSKKEVSRLSKEKDRMLKVLSGIREMKILPDIMFVVDPIEEMLAVREARKLGIITVAVCDTNSDPDIVNWVIPGNDDAARSIRLFCSVMADAVLEGKTAAAAEQGANMEQQMEAAVEPAAEGEEVSEPETVEAPETRAGGEKDGNGQEEPVNTEKK
ncbi:MAG: 30S ribosomal protein S2 [Elusimicrobia bacterium CG08_land_8_20_14_0_20_51_18]|nr:MAG: 30S ribosomal protein S2 [Elusimicrobia bacterium CG08_land_8_20_14_0_20_51_18]